MKRIKKYYKKMNNKELLDDVKEKIQGSYEEILETLINKLD